MKAINRVDNVRMGFSEALATRCERKPGGWFHAALRRYAALSYTQWEAWLALYHGKPLIIAVPEDNAPRDERYERNSEQSAAQQAHLNRLAEMERYPFCFANADRLTVEVLRSKLQEILAQAGPSVRPAPSSDSDLPKLLTLMKSAWINGFRANSLKEIVQLELGKESYTHAIDHPLKDLMRLEDQSVQPLPPNAGITEAFRMAEYFLLILGEPGSGKTITLLDLASDLIATAEANPNAPVPVVLNLSTACCRCSSATNRRASRWG